MTRKMSWSLSALLSGKINRTAASSGNKGTNILTFSNSHQSIAYMSLKSVIRFVVYVKSILGIGLFFLVFGFISNVEHPYNLIYVLTFSFPFILCFFFRGIIIRSYCEKGKYPAALLSVLSTLDQTDYLKISEIQRIHISSCNKDADYSQFLEDNSLRTTFGNKEQLKIGWLLLIGFVLFIIYFAVNRLSRIPINFGTVVLWFGILLFVLFSLQLIPRRKNKAQVLVLDPMIEFSTEKLRIENLELFWNKIIGWDYKQMHEDVDQLTIWYINVNNEKCKNVVKLTYDIGSIDLCLLFHYFKTQHESN